MSGLLGEEDRKADADTHLAAARSQNTGTGILGYTKEKLVSHNTRHLFFVLWGNSSGKGGKVPKCHFFSCLPADIIEVEGR